jgi:hypothetical protein
VTVTIESYAYECDLQAYMANSSKITGEFREFRCHHVLDLATEVTVYFTWAKSAKLWIQFVWGHQIIVNWGIYVQDYDMCWYVLVCVYWLFNDAVTTGRLASVGHSLKSTPTNGRRFTALAFLGCHPSKYQPRSTCINFSERVTELALVATPPLYVLVWACARTNHRKSEKARPMVILVSTD